MVPKRLSSPNLPKIHTDSEWYVEDGDVEVPSFTRSAPELWIFRRGYGLGIRCPTLQ